MSDMPNGMSLTDFVCFDFVICPLFEGWFGINKTYLILPHISLPIPCIIGWYLWSYVFHVFRLYLFGAIRSHGQTEMERDLLDV